MTELRTGRIWTGEECQALRRLAPIHRSDEVIGNIIGRTAVAVSEQRRRFGIRFKHRWSPADREQLRFLAAIHGSDEIIARIMNREPSSIGWQRRLLRIRLNRKTNVASISAARQKRKAISREPSDRVERMMQLATVKRAA